ncbi:methyl-accepting chemotaxis protein [Magnetococcus sp. PR-3]|uniref:methyl-accepting chemotaxis protein n=1 Tax=Magnetococcus sp. PR-3 TaxID=3120355 RepID=UPI002FCE0660
MSLRLKIIFLATLLIVTVISTQGLYSNWHIADVLTLHVEERLQGQALATAARLEDRLNRTEADLAVIAAHKDLENTFTSLLFEDYEGVTEGLSNLEMFLQRIAQAKPEYNRLQLTQSKGTPLLQLEYGERKEQFTEMPNGDALTFFQQQNNRPFHRFITRPTAKEPGLYLQTAMPLIVEGNLDGLLWVEQPIQRQLNSWMSDLQAQGFTALLQTKQGKLLAKTAVDQQTVKALSSNHLKGWERFNQPIAQHQWHMIIAKQSQVAFAVVHELIQSNILIAAVLVLLTVLGSHIMVGHLTRRIDRITATLEQLRQGELIQRIHIPHKTDELDRVAMGVNAMAENLENTVRGILLQTMSVATVVKELRHVSEQLTKDSHNATQWSNEVVRQNASLDGTVYSQKEALDQTEAQAARMTEVAQELSQSVLRIADNASAASGNATTVAAAAEEMATNVEGVNNNLVSVGDSIMQASTAVERVRNSLQAINALCQQASHASRKADESVQLNQHEVRSLLTAADQIGKVVGMINQIASQTNMLALNASIEAAGAGEAGKGFAVVANEVKELASETAKATSTIASQVEEIQRISGRVREAFDQISGEVADISHSNEAITEAVMAQDQATEAIMDAMHQVTHAAQEVTQNATELQDAASEVAQAASAAAVNAEVIATDAAQGAASAEAAAQASSASQQLTYQVKESAEDIFCASIEVQKQGLRVVETIEHIAGSNNHNRQLTDVIEEISDNLNHSVHHLDVGGHAFEIGEVKQAHLAWLGKLEAVVRQREALSPQEVASGHECAFGQWYYQEGTQQLGHLNSFQAVEKTHLHIHELAREIVHLVHDGEVEAGRQQMTQFQDTRKDLFKALDQLFLDRDAVQSSR